uniref:Peptidase M6-like domain-containing protein n=1 Tax=Prevotella sp. GTC17259 TaxID=3236795 RepID=A0AB33J028_9BACT
MKKSLLIIILSVITIYAWGAKVFNEPFSTTQSDGTTLLVSGHGDEHVSWYTTSDGAILVHVGFDYYIGKIDSYGNLTASTQLAHEAEHRSATEQALVDNQDRDAFYQKTTGTWTNKIRTREVVRSTDKYFPHLGSPKALVILAEFQDTVFKINHPIEAYKEYLNADVLSDFGNNNTSNISSIRGYFKAMSKGKFTPQFDVFNTIIKLDNNLSYYGANSGGRKDNIGALITEACQKADALGVDFSQYDSDNDGYVDLVYIIYAGYSESWSGNSSDAIWPKSGATPGGTYDGKTVYRYGVSNELYGNPATVKKQGKYLINGIGLFAHEFSHCLGLPDFYATTAAPLETQKANNQSLEYWSLMDTGEYLKNGYAPAAYTAWEREALEWFTIDTLKEASKVTLKDLDSGDSDAKAYRIMNDNDPTGHEYFIVQNIQQTNWNKYQFGHGMLVFHVDYDENAFSLSSGISANTVNNTLGHPRMTLVAADGMLLNSSIVTDQTSQNAYRASAAADPFPGTTNTKSLTDDTTVKPTVYNGTALAKPIYKITEANGVITFNFLKEDIDTATGIIGIPAEVAGQLYKDDRIYSIDGRYLGTDKTHLPKGIYIMNRKKIVIQ